LGKGEERKKEQIDIKSPKKEERDRKKDERKEERLDESDASRKKLIDLGRGSFV